MTAPAEQAFTPFRASVLRATRLDGCGAPDTVSTAGSLVTDGLISVEWKGQVDTGTDVEVKNAAGKLKVSSPAKPTLKYVDTTLTLVGVDPQLYEMWTGQQLVTDGQGKPVGIRGQEYIATKFGVALETWTEIGLEDGGDCVAGAELWGYFLLPYIVNGMIGDVTLNDGAMSCTLTGRTKRGSQWGVGPASYLPADSSVTAGTVTPGPLAVAIGATDHYHMQMTPVAPPAVTAGAVKLT